MRILHVLPTLDPAFGGPVTGTRALARACTRQGLWSTLYPPQGSWGGGRALAYLPGPKQLRGLIEHVRSSDVVVIHGLWTVTGCVAAYVSRRARTPYVVVPHGMLDRWALARGAQKKRLFDALAQRCTMERAAAIRFLNDDELQEAHPYGLTAPCFVLPNGVSAEDLEAMPDRADPASEFRHLSHKAVVLFLGRLHEKKGLELLIPAFARALRRCPDLYLILAGPDEGGYRRRLERRISQHRVCDAVVIAGMLTGEARRQALGAADLFVLPSLQEGDSQAIKEAMAAKLPVIISRGCHFDAVERAGAGLVVDPDVDDLEAALVRLGTDGASRQTMGLRGRALIEREFTWERLSEQFRNVLDDICRGTFSSPAWRTTGTL